MLNLFNIHYTLQNIQIKKVRKIKLKKKKEEEANTVSENTKAIVELHHESRMA